MGRHSADSDDVTSWAGSVDPSKDDLDEALFAELSSQLNSVRSRRVAAPTAESLAAEQAAMSAEPVEAPHSRYEQPVHSSDNWVAQYSAPAAKVEPETAPDPLAHAAPEPESAPEPAVKSELERAEALHTAVVSTGDNTPAKASRLMHRRMHHSAKPKNKEHARTRPAKTSAEKKRGYGKVATWSAIAFIAGLAIATTVPANAFFTPAQLSASQNDSIVTEIKTEDGQTLRITGEQAAAARDSVTSAQVAKQYDGSTSLATYVNDPNGTIQYPFKTTVRISDLFGLRVAPCAWCSTDHKGVDFDPGLGAPIQIIADGVVTDVHEADDGGLGYNVVVDHNIDGLKFQSVYAHLLPGSIQVHVGDQVKVTQIVAQVGNTGTSTGPHLHFEIHVNNEPVDPLAWLKEHAN